MSYPSLIIADYFVQKEYSLKNDIMKVLKLVYISHGYYLAFTEEPLINEDVQAWQYGPVIPELYFRLKTDSINPYEFNDDYERFKKDDSLKSLLDAVFDKYRQFSGIELSNLTHQKDTPWDITVSRFGSRIDNELIKSHYKKLIGE